MSWEERFTSWSKGPGTEEEERCERVISAIRDAVNSSPKLTRRNVTVFVQGSYRNRVNVRQDSDVDVGVSCKDVIFGQYPDGMSMENFGMSPSDYYYINFKDDLEEALVNKFGRKEVNRGNKAFDIKSNTYRVDADVTAFFEHRRYYKDGTYTEGVELRSDNNNKSIINWPEQHYNNGTKKNSDTSRRYKRLVRILKKLNYEMQDIQNSSATDIPGFLCECLMWNVPNKFLVGDSFSENLQNSLHHLYQSLGEDASNQWGEVSELKYLFGAHQKWTKLQARNFVLGAYQYVGF